MAGYRRRRAGHGLYRRRNLGTELVARDGRDGARKGRVPHVHASLRLYGDRFSTLADTDTSLVADAVSYGDGASHRHAWPGNADPSGSTDAQPGRLYSYALAHSDCAAGWALGVDHRPQQRHVGVYLAVWLRAAHRRSCPSGNHHQAKTS